MKISTVTVGLPVADLERAKDWYRQLFARAEEQVPIDGVWEISPAASFWLQLFEQVGLESSAKVVRFETSDIDAAHSLVKRIGGQAVTDVESVPDVVKYFDFRDPFGNLLSFYEMLAREEASEKQSHSSDA